jgi:hypothetical protein
LSFGFQVPFTTSAANARQSVRSLLGGGHDCRGAMDRQQPCGCPSSTRGHFLSRLKSWIILSNRTSAQSKSNAFTAVTRFASLVLSTVPVKISARAEHALALSARFPHSSSRSRVAAAEASAGSNISLLSCGAVPGRATSRVDWMTSTL